MVLDLAYTEWVGKPEKARNPLLIPKKGQKKQYATQ